MLFRKNRVAQLLKQAQSANPEQRESAWKELSDLENLSVEEARTALEAARESYTVPEGVFIRPYEDPQELLIHIALKTPDPSFVSIVARDFERYSPEARAAACELLLAIDTGESLNLLRELLLQYAPVGIADTSLLLSSKRQAEHLFPDVLVLLSDSRVGAMRFSLAQECLKAFHKEWFSARQFDDYASHVLTAYREVETHLLPYQNPEALRTMWDNEKYLEWRWAGGVMLDLMGYFPTPEVLEALQQALQKYVDPYLLLYAVVSLVCYAEVDPQVIHTVAASAETRERLYEWLESYDKLELFPTEFREQRWLAESHMVDWLKFPTELGRPPDEIEWMGAYPILTEGGEAEVHLFRFRVDDEPWEAGIAGSYLLSEIPTTNHLGGTFSRFDKWDECTPEEHVERILSTVGTVRRVQTPAGERIFWRLGADDEEE